MADPVFSPHSVSRAELRGQHQLSLLRGGQMVYAAHIPRQQAVLPRYILQGELYTASVNNEYNV